MFFATFSHAQEPPIHSYALALHGEPALPLGFAHFPYTRLDAPKGGILTLGIAGTFDTLNPFVVPGSPAQGMTGPVIETLMARNYAEPFTLYGLIAETVATPADRSFVEFRLNNRAAFSDGKRIEPEDIIFSWQLLKDHGRPNYRSYYSKVGKAEIIDSATVRFSFAEKNDRELPLILALMPIFPRYATPTEHFGRTGFVPLLGSGPYTVTDVKPGHSVTFTRNLEYWGASLPSRRGTHNFDRIRYDYYRDGNSLFEAFKKGLYDYREESDPAQWAAGYDFKAVKEGEVVLETLPRALPSGMYGLSFNTRRPLFQNKKVRQALSLLFDFEWLNATFYHGLYRRTGSYFDGSELSARGLAADDAERALLAPFRDAVDADILEGSAQPATSDGSGRDRTLTRKALGLLKEAGWNLQGGQLKNTRGETFAFEILVKTREQERFALAYSRQLAQAGIAARVRLTDSIQFERRMNDFDFDMAPYFWFASLSPGNEQAFYWGSAAAQTAGSRNYMGVASPAVDAMIQRINGAESRDQLISAVRALDRILLSGNYVIPLYHAPDYWVARRERIQHPDHMSMHGPLVETFWDRHSGK